MQKSEAHVFAGLNQDRDPHRQDAQFLVDALNVRLTSRGNSTSLAVTAEKSTVQVTIHNSSGESIDSIPGNYVGHYVFNQYVVVFTTVRDENDEITTNDETTNGEKPDYIIRLEKLSDTEFDYKVLFQGDAGFSINHPIEATGFYENENLQKVYWTDGINQPRMLNIVAIDNNTDGEITITDTDLLNFSRELTLTEEVYIKKNIGTTGNFPAGALQYCITYYSKHGQESSIVWQSPLIYTSFTDRAGNPEEVISNAYDIIIKNPNGNNGSFDYVRLYSILRTSHDATPLVKRVADAELVYPEKEGGEVTITITDNGIIGDSIDPAELLYKGGEETRIGTLCQKDNTLFLGNIETTRPAITLAQRKAIWNKKYYKTFITSFRKTYKDKDIDDNGFYPDDFMLDLKDDDGYYVCPLTFKSKEQYRFGIQLQYKNGKWTDPIMIGDYVVGNNTVLPKSESSTSSPSLVPEEETTGTSTYSLSTNTYGKEGGTSGSTGGSTGGSTTTKTTATITTTTVIDDGSGTGTGSTGSTDGTTTTTTTKETKTITETVPIRNRRSSLLTVKNDIDLTPFAGDFKKVRGVVVIPTLQERHVIAQGVLCPTVWSYRNRRKNTSVFSQSSWFIRPMYGNNKRVNTSGDGISYSNNILEYRDMYTLGYGFNANAEIQGLNDDYTYSPYYNEHENTRTKFGSIDQIWSNIISSDITNITRKLVKDRKSTVDEDTPNDTDFVTADEVSNLFLVSQQYSTFHSADLQFDDSLKAIDYSGLQMWITGMTVGFRMGNVLETQTSTPTISPSGSGIETITRRQDSVVTPLCSGFWYGDYLVEDTKLSSGYYTYGPFDRVNDKTKKPYDDAHEWFYKIFPWQKSGSLNNDYPRKSTEGEQTAVLKTKKLSSIKIFNTEYFTSTVDLQANDIVLFNSDQLTVEKINSQTYFGNINTVLAPPVKFGVLAQSTEGDYTGKSVPLDYAMEYTRDDGYIGDQNKSIRTSRESVRMKYKSTPHLVVNLGISPSDIKWPLSDLLDIDNGVLPIVDITREGYPFSTPIDYTNSEATVGYPSEDILKSHMWIPAGDAIEIESGVDDENNPIKTTVEWKYGDTFFQRFDFLKTYPFAEGDENSIIEIGSFNGEFRVNADGRYDKNKGQLDNSNMRPTNFNLYNPVYSQLNNFFNYRILDSSYYSIDNFSNAISWTLEKEVGGDVDTWTSVTLASTTYLNGTKGPVNAIRTFNDTIYAFQDTGICNIPFNSRVQIPTSDNVPIEITNNYKVDSPNYISDTLGCSNKWSIINGESGMFFIDSNSKDLYTLSAKGEAPNNLSYTKEMYSWFSRLSTNSWHLNSGVKVHYDYINNDLYISDGDCSSTTQKCLNYSEKTENFISIFDYESAPALFNVDKQFYGLHQTANGLSLHQMFASDDVSTIFNTSRDYSISFISNSDAGVDKIFSNIELKADWRNSLGDLADGEGVYSKLGKDIDFYDIKTFFDKIRVSNEYQDTGEQTLTEAKYRGSNLKRKFRSWGINIPRDSKRKVDRIRNPWCKIELIKKNSDVNSMSPKPFILHDISVKYYT